MPSTVPLPAKPRPYRRFANSALHTNFVYCIALTLLWHLILQGLTSNWYTSVRACLWAFFPLSLSGIRTVFFDITSILLFFHQIGTLDTGRRSYASRWKTFSSSIRTTSTYLAFFWYIVSAAWFSVTLASTASSSWQLHWTVNGGYGAPDRLNERPIYLRAVFLLLGVVHAVVHNYYDLSSLPLNKSKDNNRTGIGNINAQLAAEAPGMLKRAGLYSAVVNISAPFFYHSIFRNAFWSWHITWARLFANIPRSEQNPPTSPYLGSAMLWGFVFSCILSLTWQFNIMLFRLYMLQQPVRNGVPLSALSKDPNGTLLNGLSAKSQVVKTLAFWELDVIAKTSPDRRKNIFGDFERPGQGPIFTSMMSAALAVIQSIPARIDEMENPTSMKPPTEPYTNPADDPSIERLPRILPSSKAAQNQIYQEPVTNAVSKTVKTLGSSTDLYPSPKQVRALADKVPGIYSSVEQGVKQQPMVSVALKYMATSPTCMINSAILGSPVANPDLITLAVSSSTALLVASLTEDAFGKAVQCVPSTVQCFASAIFAIEGFVKKHTNGGDVSATTNDELRDMLRLHQTLKGAMKELLDKFRLFLNDVGLSIRDLNEAQKAAEDRALLTVVTSSLRPDPKGALEDAPAPREMEEPARRRVSDSVKGGSMQVQKRATGDVRPGRLFKQLDDDSAYQDSLRKRRNSTKHRDTEEKNPLATRRNPEMVDNVLGAKDLGIGGLQSRRVGTVR